MTLKDKYTYLALMALAMFGIGFWMLSIGGGLSSPPSIPDPLAQQSSVADQFKGSLNLGNKEIEDKLKEVLLIPKTFEQFGTTKCVKDEKIVRNFLNPGETSYYLSHEQELSARDYLRRIDPVNFYHLVLHFNSKENKWASLGTKVGNIAVTGSELDSYKIPAGEPVLVILIGFQEDEDRDTFFDPDTGETKKLVYVKHCQNSFPSTVKKLNTGWNLLVSDLVQVADDPHALSVAALDSNSLVANMDLNTIQSLSTQLEGVLSWVNYDPTTIREGFNANNNIPRLSLNLKSDAEVELSYSRIAQEIATYEVVPQNSPNIKAVALRAMNVEDFKFSDVFSEVFFRVNGKELVVSDLDNNTLIAYFDGFNSDDLFAEDRMKIAVFAKTHSENSVDNLQLSMAFDLGESRVATTILPPVFIGFEEILVDTYFELPNSDAKLANLELEDNSNRAKLVFKLLNNTRNSVNVNSVFLPFKNANGLSSTNVTPGIVKLDVDVEEFDGNENVLINSEGIYLYPNKEITLASRQPRIVPVVLNFDSEIISKLEFGKLQLDTNAIDLDYNHRVLKVSYKPEQEQPSTVATQQTEQEETRVVQTEEEESPQVAVNQETQNAFGGLFGRSAEDQPNQAEDENNQSSSTNVQVDLVNEDVNENLTTQTGIPEEETQELDSAIQPPDIDTSQLVSSENTSTEDIDFGFSSSLEERVVLTDNKPVLAMQLNLSDGHNFNTLDLEDYNNSYADQFKLLVKVDGEYKKLNFQSLTASNGEIYVSRGDNLAGTYEYVQFDLIGAESAFFTIILPTIDVYQTKDSMSNFVQLLPSENQVENFELALKYELLEFDYIFDTEDDEIHVNPMQIVYKEIDGMRMEIRLENGELLDFEKQPSEDQLRYPVTLVSLFKPDFFEVNPEYALEIGFEAKEMKNQNVFKFNFNQEQKLEPVIKQELKEVKQGSDKKEEEAEKQEAEKQEKAEQEEARRKAEQEQARRKAEQEQARRKAEQEEAQKKAEAEKQEAEKLKSSQAKEFKKDISSDEFMKLEIKKKDFKKF